MVMKPSPAFVSISPESSDKEGSWTRLLSVSRCSLHEGGAENARY